MCARSNSTKWQISLWIPPPVQLTILVSQLQEVSLLAHARSKSTLGLLDLRSCRYPVNHSLPTLRWLKRNKDNSLLSIPANTSCSSSSTTCLQKFIIMQINRHGPPFYCFVSTLQIGILLSDVGIFLFLYSNEYKSCFWCPDNDHSFFHSVILPSPFPQNEMWESGDSCPACARFKFYDSKRGANLPPHSATVALEQAAELNLVPLNHVARSIAVSQPSVG